MKTIISTMAIATVLGVCAAAENTTLSTADGTSYENISFQRADPDGLYIEYHPGGTGLGVAKVKFSRLSTDLQKQYGYDSAKAAQYEAQASEAGQAWVKAAMLREQAAKEELAARSERDDRMEIERFRVMNLMRAPEGNPGAADSVYYGGSYGGGLWLTPEPQLGLDGKHGNHGENHNNLSHDHNRPFQFNDRPVQIPVPNGGIPYGHGVGSTSGGRR